MARLTITPVRSIAAGYTLGVPVDLDFLCEDIDRDVNIVKTENQSMSGAREIIGDRIEYIWHVTTVQIASASRDLWRMLMESIAFGESFQLDVEGTIASPSSQLATCTLDGRFDEKTADSRYYRYTFKAKKI